MDNIGLNVTSIRLPAKSQFPELIEHLVNACHEFRHLKKKPSSKAQVDRYLHCHTLIEGLYQTWCCHSPYPCLMVLSQFSNQHQDSVSVSGLSPTLRL